MNDQTDIKNESHTSANLLVVINLKVRAPFSGQFVLCVLGVVALVHTQERVAPEGSILTVSVSDMQHSMTGLNMLHA